MAATLEARAIERGTYIVSVDFADEDGNPVVPTSVSWTLSTEDGQIQNGRTDVSETPAASLEVLLEGDDLAIDGAIAKALIFTVNAFYDGALGSGLPIVGQCVLEVLGLEGGSDVLYGS